MSVTEFIHMEMERLEKFLHRRQRRKPENVNERHGQRLTLQDRIALGITGALGTMMAVYVLSASMLIWIIWQYLTKPFDPYPFTFLICITSILQMVLMPLIMVGQNLQSRHSELRAEEQYQTTLESYEDIEHVLTRLDHYHRELLRQTHMLQELLQIHGKSVAPGLMEQDDVEPEVQRPEHKHTRA